MSTSAGILAGLLLQGLVLSATPFQHHDLECHLRSATHCTACVATPLASRVERASGPDATQLLLTGRLLTHHESAPRVYDRSPTSSRGPPL